MMVTVFVAEQDNEEEIKDEANWIKSNPILEVEALYDKMMSYLRNVGKYLLRLAVNRSAG